MRHLSTPEKFWLSATKTATCWFWNKAVAGRKGMQYGSLTYQGKHWTAHRLAYTLATGETLVAGDVIRHSCDTPLCINPTHLLKGTVLDNTRDMINRGRARHPGQLGELNGNSKLTYSDVIVIRAYAEAGYSSLHISQAMGIKNARNIRRIISGERWSLVS